MKMLLSAIFLLSASVLTPAQGGSWNTSNPNKITTITGVLLEEVKVVSLRAGLPDSSTLREYQLIVDGTTLTGVFAEGGMLTVAGRNIVIKQTDTNSSGSGGWFVQTGAQRESVSNIIDDLGFVTAAPANKEYTLANFQNAKSVLLVVGSPLVPFGSLTQLTPTCTGALVTIFVDGVSIKDSTGSDILFPIGSTTHVRGRNIRVKFSGTCASGSKARVSFKLFNRNEVISP